MTFPAHLRTSTVVALAENIRQSRDYGLLKFLADALEDAGADGADLSPLRDPGIADSRSGLWLAGVRGWDGLWEWGQLWHDVAAMGERAYLQAGWTLDQLGDLKAAVAIRSRRAELQRLHTGPCPTCLDRRQLHGRSSDCPTCVLAVRERWDECRCPPNPSGCGGKGTRRVHAAGGIGGDVPCQTCGGSGDLLRHRQGGYTNDISCFQPRPISYSLGPLPVVTVRLEEMVREERCEGVPRVGREADPPHRPDCDLGTGVIHVPSAWLAAMPPEYDVTLAGMEPERSGQLWWFRGLPSFLDFMPLECFSPAAAHAALRSALRRWRYGL